MSLSKTLALLRHEKAKSFISSPNLSCCHSTYPVPLFLVRSFCSSLETIFLRESESNAKAEEKKKKKPLTDFFREAVGLAPTTEDLYDGSGTSRNDLSRQLSRLELEIRELKEKDSILQKFDLAGDKKEKKSRDEELETEIGVVDDMKETIASSSSLYALFTDKAEQPRKPNVRKEAPLNKDKQSKDVNRRKQAPPTPKDDQVNRRKVAPILIKELSPDMEVFLRYLNKEGYFRNANFLNNGTLDLSCFNDSYSRDFIKFAAEKFGKDHQEIAKWLSGSELKKVALFGCPTTDRKNVFAAKKMRIFFSIAEDTVCSKCVMRRSCKFVNQSVWKSDTKNLNLASIMRVITLYALDLVPPELVLTDELKMSVNRLLRDIINLSQTTSPVQLQT